MAWLMSATVVGSCAAPARYRADGTADALPPGACWRAGRLINPDPRSAHDTDSRRYPLAGRTAVVAGGSSGVGRATALRLAAEGAHVTVVGRNESRLAQLLDVANAGGGCGPGRIAVQRTDLTDDPARRELMAALREGPRVDLLVLSAGIYRSGTHTDAQVHELDALYEANVRAPYALTQELLPMLRRGGGDIVVVNSTQGIRASRDVGQYAATQHAMRAIADTLRQEVNDDDVRVCIIHLGRTATRLQEAIFAEEGRPYTPELLLQPEDVADVVAAVTTLSTGAEMTEIHLRPARRSY